MNLTDHHDRKSEAGNLQSNRLKLVCQQLLARRAFVQPVKCMQFLDFAKTCSFILFLGAVIHLQADVIYLKNGRKIEGTVISETDDQVVFKMAMGEVTYSRSKIERIERNAEGDAERLIASQSAKFAQEIQDLKRSVASVYSKKGTVSMWARRCKEKQSSIGRMEESRLRKHRERVEVLKDLERFAKYEGRGIPSRLYGEYSTLFSRQETLFLEIQGLESDIEYSRGELQGFTDKLVEVEGQFMTHVAGLKSKYQQLIAQGCPPEALESVQRSLGEEVDVLSRQEIPLRKDGNAYWITVTINDRHSREFILDTGCSEIALSRGLYQELRLPSDKFLGKTQGFIADGSSHEIDVFVLDSVKVGSFEVKNAMANAPSVPGPNEAPLLLGMGFLKHFHFTIDTRRSKLILERLSE
ncbi:MAG: retroviral-like aspartic protease family protein [Opitutales bacterium]|nr:retroviral-like aspartic protease family protein [Opitutales bacterium]